MRPTASVKLASRGRDASSVKRLSSTMRMPALLLPLVVTLAGCAAGPTPAELMALTQFGEKVTMNVPAGKYQRHIIEGLNDGKPVEITAALSQPRSSPAWAPSIRICARGDQFFQQSCLWLTVDGDQKTIYASSYSGKDPAEASRSVLPYRSRVGATMPITLKLTASSFALSVDGKPLFTKATEFEVKGYSFGCESAICSFYLPD